MNKLIVFIFLSLLSFTALAQQTFVPHTITRYPVFDNVPEHYQTCRDVIVDNGYSPGGAIVGAAVGYALGRQLDRGYQHRGYVVPVPHRGYVPGRGRYYRDGYYVQGGYDSHAGRVGGAVAGGMIGAQVNRGQSVTRVCEDSRMSRNVLVGYRVVTRYNDGRMEEYFEPR